MTDYTDLVQRLRDYPVWTGDCHDAADAIEAQGKRIAELEAALKPFADKANEYDNPRFPYHDSSLQTGLPVGWLRQARKVLESK